MSIHSEDVWAALHIWCYFAGIVWPITWLFEGKRKLTAEEKWEVFREVAQTPQLMADGVVMQRIEWKYVPFEPKPAETATGVRPATIVHGARPVPQ